MADELDDVDRGAEAAQVIEVLAEALPASTGGLLPMPPIQSRTVSSHARRDGTRREAAHADDLGGDALAHLGLRAGTRVVDEVRM